MRHSESIPAPDVEGILEEAELWTELPLFDYAMKRFCFEMVAFHGGSRIANLGMGHTLAWAAAVLIVYLDHQRAEGVTSTEILRLCDAGGIGGRKAVGSAIDALRSAGLVSIHPKPNDARAKRLRPTAALFDLHHDNLAARLTALEILQPLSAPASEVARRLPTLLAFLGGNVEAFARTRFRLYDKFPEVRAFMDRSCGYMILLDLLRRVHFPGDEPLTSEASPSHLAAQFHVSRAHVRKLLQNAHENGWILAPEGGQIILDPRFFRRMRLWIGAEFVWMWRLVGREARDSQTANPDLRNSAISGANSSL